MAAFKRSQNSTAALERDVAHLLRILVGSLGEQRTLHPVLRTDGATATDRELRRVSLVGVDEVLEGLVRRIGCDDENAVVRTDGTEPTDGSLVVLTELALREQESRAGRRSSDQVRIGSALGDDVVVGDRTDAAFHVGHSHRLLDFLGGQKTVCSQAAGQVEATAGLGASQALGLRRLGLSASSNGEDRECGTGQRLGECVDHGCLPSNMLNYGGQSPDCRQSL